MTTSMTSEELILAKELIYFIYGFTFIMLLIAFTILGVGDLVVDSKIYKRFIENPRCHRCDKECAKHPIGLGNEFLFVCPDANCQEPSE
jgi:hypothetical protein